MKKHFLKSFALLAMLFSALTMSAATQYCDVLLEAADGDVKYSLYHVSGNTYGIQVVPQDGMALTGIANPNIGVNQSAGAGITIVKDLWTISNNVATAIFQTASETSVPTNFFTAYICFNKTGGKTGRDLVEITIPASDIDWTTTCGISGETPGEGGEDPEPTPDPTVTPGYSAGAGTNYTYLYTNDAAGNVYLWLTFNEAIAGAADPHFYTNDNQRVNATTTDQKVFFASVSGKKDGDNVQLRAYIPRAGGVTETQLLSHTVGVSEGLIVTEYCDYTDSQLTQNGAAITLTWETADNGDVVITMGNGIGATSCAFRNGGFEGGINAFVVSTDNFVTTSPASDYFTYTPVYSGNEARLVKIADLPKGTKIKYNKTAAFSWTVNEAGPYIWTDFIYTYGGVCNKLDAPTNVAVTDAGVLTFDEVVGANAYEVHVYQGTTLKHTQNIVNGGTINFEVYVAGTYTVKVIAKGEGKGDSSESDPVSWNMQASPLPGSNYCETPADRITTNNGACNPLFTWNTDASGNVVITVSASEGDEGATMFRNNGMNGAFSLDGSEDNFNAYFNRSKTDDYTYTLTLKDAANKPALGSVISFSGQIEAKSSIHDNDWSNYDFDGYLYGTKCATLDAPTNVAITPAGVLTFDAVEGADSYLVHVYDGATLKLEAAIASGNTVEFYSFIDKTYQVCVVAKAGSAKSEESDKVDWAVTAAFLNTPSEYCEQVVTSGANSVIFDWQTNAEGSIIITISEADGGAAGTTHFRAQGMSPADLNKFKIGESREAANLYFERVYTENEQVYELRLKAGKQLVPGTKIYHTGDVEFVSESEGTNAYHNYGFEYTYGTRCVGYQVSATPADPVMGTAVVKQNGVEVTSVEGGTVQFIATPAEGCVFVNWTKDGVEVSTAATYETQITATTRLVANFDYIRTIYCQTPVLTSAGHTVYLTIGEAATAGKYQIKIEGSSEVTITDIIVSNTAMNFIKFTDINGTTHDGNDVYLTKENGGFTFSPEGYGVITSAEFEPRTGYTWKDMLLWGPYLFFKTNLSAEENIDNILNETTKNEESTETPRHFNWSNVCEADTEKPVMGTAELVSQSHNTATIAVTATDNRMVHSYHVVSTNPAHDQTIEPVDGNITVTGLTANTDYTFTITAIDLAGLESENNATVSVKTKAYIAEPSSLPTAPTWPANQVQAVYSETYDANCEFGDWGSGTQYTQDTYGKKYVTAAGGYFGLTGFKLNCSKMETLHMDIWCANNTSLGIVPIYKENQGGNEDKRVTKSIVGGQWNSIEIPLADFVGVPSWNNVHQIKIDNVPNQTLWINNVYFYTTQAPTDTEAPINITATATPSFETAVISCSATDESGSVKFRVMLGDEPKGTGNANSGETTNITVTNLQAGRTFTLQVYASDVYGNEAVEPIEVNFTTNPYPEPAPTPMWAADNVKSIYSESYAPAFTSLNSYNEGWWNAPQMLDAAIAPDNHALYYYGFTDGMIGWQFAAFDATGYTTFTMDIYPMNDGTIDFGPLNEAPANDYAITGIPVKGGQWNTITVDLRDKDLTQIFQLKMINYYSLGAFFIDNVYLYKIVIDENTDLTKLANGLECDVTLKRNFAMGDDGWNTISLPFALNAQQIEDIFGDGTKVTKLTSSNLISSTEIDLQFVEVTAMEAATPYLIHPTNNVDAGALVEDVVINVTPNIIEAGITQMIPVLKTENFTGKDNAFFLGPDDNLYNQSADGKIKALRAYFKFSTLTPAQLNNLRARVVFNENTETGVDNLITDEAPTKMIQNGQLIIIRNGIKYNVQGQKL